MINIEIDGHEDVVRFGKQLQIRGKSARVVLGPHANSDYIEIERDEETREVRFIFNRAQESIRECVFSAIEEI